MDWKTYCARFNDWEESTQLRHLSTLTSFGPSAEVCELAGEFFEEKSATRLIKKALAAGVRFTAKEVIELDGVIDDSLLPQLIKTTSHPLTADQLNEFSFWLSSDEIRALARKNHIRLDEDGYVMTEDMIEAEAEALEAEKEMLRFREKEAARAEEELLIAKAILAVCCRCSRKRREKRREKR